MHGRGSSRILPSYWATSASDSRPCDKALCGLDADKAAMGKRELNILFSCVGSSVGLLGAFRRAMAELGLTGKIIVSDQTITAAALHFGDASAVLPAPGSEAYVPALLALVEKHEAGLLVPLGDADLPLLAGARERFLAAGCTVVVGSEPVVAMCADGGRFAEALSQAGLRVLRTVGLEEFRRRPFFPCLVCPVSRPNRAKGLVIHSEADFARRRAGFTRPVLIQPHLACRDFCVDVYRSRDGVVRRIVPWQPLGFRGPEVDKGVTARGAEVIVETIRLAGLLGDAWGVFRCRCSRTEDGAVWFRGVSLRFDDGVELSIAAGADLPGMLLREVLGQPIAAEVHGFREGLLMLRYEDAAFVRADEPGSLPGYQTPNFT